MHCGIALIMAFMSDHVRSVFTYSSRVQRSGVTVISHITTLSKY